MSAVETVLRQQRGVTLLELMLTTVLLALLLSQAAPSYGALTDRHRLRAVATELYAAVASARRDALRLNRPLTVSIHAADSAWCLGVSEEGDCDCRRSVNCRVAGRTAVLSSVNGVRLDPGRVAKFSFTPPWGFSRTGHLELHSPRGLRLRLLRSALGRLRWCSPDLSSALTGYPPC